MQKEPWAGKLQERPKCWSTAILVVASSLCVESLKTKIFRIKKNDVISKAAQQNELVCELGFRLLKQHKEHHINVFFHA